MFNIRRQRIFAIAGYVLVVAIAGFVIVPQLDTFAGSQQQLATARLPFVLLAIGFIVLTYMAAAAIYRSIAFRGLYYRRTLLVQLAGLFVNRIVPAGAGGIGLNFLYLRAHRHTKVQATAVVATNATISAISHVVLLIIMIALVVARQEYLPRVTVSSKHVLIAAVVLVLLGLTVLFVSRTKRFKKSMVVLRHYTARQITAALLWAATMTLATVASLYACLYAMDVSVSFPVVFVLFTAAVTTGTAVPTPGGLGGFEAALVAGLIAIGITPPTALAATLLFRLLTYWAGLVVGVIALTVLMHRNYLLRSHSKVNQ